jgi:multidrug resistance efflux pump
MTVQPEAVLPAVTAGEAPAPAAADVRPPVRRRRPWLSPWRLSVLLVLVVGGGVLLFAVSARRRPRARGATHPVHREILRRALVSRGDLEAVESTNILCRVQATSPNATNSTTIRWLIDDGTLVRRGQLLVELDDAPFRDGLQTQKVARELAQSEFITAEENLKIVRSQNESDIKTAAVTLQLAEIDLKKYLQGDYRQARKELAGKLAEAETNLRMWQDRAGWSSRMVRHGFTTAVQSKVDRAKLLGAELAVQGVREEIRVLDQFTYRRTRTDLGGKVAEARRALARVRRQARAKEAVAAADRLAKEHIYVERAQQCQDTEKQIQHCRIYAPHDGLALYYVSTQSRHGSGSQQAIVAQGEPVREGQILLRLPDLSRMAVRLRLHEAVGGRMRGEVWEPTGLGECLQAALLFPPNRGTCLLGQRAFAELRPRFHYLEHRRVYDGQPALVTVGAVSGRALHGHVRQVANVLTQESHWVDIKTYEAQVVIDETVEGLRPDLSADVTIFDQSEQGPVLAVPLQAIVHSPRQGNHCTCYVVTPDGPEARDVVVGAQNDEMAEVRSGLEEGEEVVLNPRWLVNDKGDAGAAAD